MNDDLQVGIVLCDGGLEGMGEPLGPIVRQHGQRHGRGVGVVSGWLMRRQDLPETFRQFDGGLGLGLVGHQGFILGRTGRAEQFAGRGQRRLGGFGGGLRSLSLRCRCGLRRVGGVARLGLTGLGREEGAVDCGCRDALLGAPAVPHLAVGGFEVAAENPGVAQGRVHQPMPHGLADALAGVVLLGESGGFGDVFSRAGRAAHVHAQAMEDAVADPAGVVVAEQRDDRHALEEGFHGGRRAVVGVGVQGDVHAPVGAEVVDGVLDADDVQPIALNTALGEVGVDFVHQGGIVVGTDFQQHA